MRLTLLTLLAYLDNDSHLNAEDAQALKEKIEKSDFASGLVMRIKSISKKLRMSAPKVEGKGLGRDPNTVATYLEGDLPPERLGEFERLCLESDVHLAEVASCHQVLSMVLSKPANVPPQIREKMYALGTQSDAARVASPNRIDGSHAASADGKSGSPPLPPKPSSAATSASLLAMPSDNGKTAEPVAPAAPASPKMAEVPDYLRAGRGGFSWPMVAAIAAVFLLVLGILRLMGPFNTTHPIARMLGMGGAEVAVTPTDPNAPQPVPPPNPAPLVPGPAIVTPPVPMPVPPVNVPANPNPLNPIEPVPFEPVPMPVPVPPVPGPGERPVNPPPPPMPVENPAEPKPVEPVPPEPMPGEPKPLEPKPLEPKPLEPKPLEPRPIAPLPVPPPTNPSETVDVGRFTSDEQLLVHLVSDPQSKANLWYRLAPRSLLLAGDRMIVLPTYRPQLALASGVQATFAGESAFRIERPAQAGGAKVAVEYGRVMLAAVGAAGGKVELNLAGINGTITLADADAAVAIEVRRFVPPGVAAHDPKAEVVRVIDMFALGGRVVWQAAEEQAVEIPPSHVVVYVADEFPRSGGPFEPPAWTDAKSLPDIERRASTDMEAELAVDKPLDISLAEHAAGRRVEIRSLASRCLASLDQFEPILAELNEPKQYSYWAGDIDSLRFALSRSSESAARVLATLQNQRPENGRLLYEMLLGASDEQLVGGSAEKLVKSLESNEIDVRVVALDSLRRTTGQMLMYRPEKTLASNSTSIQKWKEKLKDNLISNRIPPSPLNEYKAATQK